MKTTSKKPPRRPASRLCSSKKSKCGNEDDEEEAPPDPRSRSTIEISVQCLLREIDDRKLILLISGHPSSRSSALLIQALRQQMSVAALDEYVADALDWIISNDVLMLKMKKNSLFSRVIQADGVDSREQMARLVNTMASYPAGRQYFTNHQKIFLPCLVAILRGKRLPSTTHDQMIACIQKMSVRPSAQKDMIQNGVLEWAFSRFDQKLNNYAFEYLAAMIINLTTNSLSQQLLVRLADSIANSVASLLAKITHGPYCSLYNSMVLSILSCNRIRLRSKETRLLESIRTRLDTRPNCSLCNLHIPFLRAIINQEVDYCRPPSSPNDTDGIDKAGVSCEREIDSLDPLRPSTNELSGARLLIRKAYKEPVAESHLVPGQVPYNNPNSGRKSNSRRSERVGTATSQHTFVIETERRRPIVVNIGLTDGAVEYRKHVDEKNREEEKRRKKEAETKQKALRNIQLTSRKPPPRKQLSENVEDGKKVVRMSTAQKKPQRATTVGSNSANATSKPSSRPSDLGEKPISMYEYTPAAENADDYNAVFGSRPKVARTPDAQSKSFF